MNFRNIISKYVKQYDEGKIKSHDVVYVDQKTIPLENKKQIELPSPKQVKLRTTLTSGQILYLFKTLLEIKAIDPLMSKVDICRFISDSISSKDFENLSADNLAKKWSDINVNDIAYWYENHPEIAKLVIKDNPLKIKYNSKKNK